MPAKSVTEVIELFFDRRVRCDVRSSHGNVYIDGDILYSYDWQNPIAVDLRSSPAEFYLIAGGEEKDYDSGVMYRHVQQAQETVQIKGTQHIIVPRKLEGFGSMHTSDDEMLEYAINSLREYAKGCHVENLRLRERAREHEVRLKQSAADLQTIGKRFRLSDDQVRVPDVWIVRPARRSR
jgi:hypothetical protein